MSEKISRRKLIEKGASAAVAGTIGVCAGPALRRSAAAERAPVKGVDYYQKLGVTPLINAAGTYTFLTASTMPEEVQAAVALASPEFHAAAIGGAGLIHARARARTDNFNRLSRADHPRKYWCRRRTATITITPSAIAV